jgi:Zn-dependent protease
LPPFDGYNVLEPFLDESIRVVIDRFRDITIWVIFLLFWFVPAFSSSFWDTVFRVSSALGVDLYWAIQGLQRFRFWEL